MAERLLNASLVAAFGLFALSSVNYAVGVATWAILAPGEPFVDWPAGILVGGFTVVEVAIAWLFWLRG